MNHWDPGMAKRGHQTADWTQKGRAEQLAQSEQTRLKRVRRILASAKSKAHADADRTGSTVCRPGVRIPTYMRYARKSASPIWSGCELGRRITDSVLASVEDGADRVVLAWPKRPGSAFAAAALALREARASGALSHATLGYWPWRSGATWSARSILVSPEALVTCARHISTHCEQTASWQANGIAHRALCMTELRLADLVSSGRAKKNGSSAAICDLAEVVVRSPSLLETTATFPPSEQPGAPYLPDCEQVLKRVRAHTKIGKLEAHGASVGNPDFTPFALLGLPGQPKPEHLRRYLSCARIVRLGLDAIVVDLTDAGRLELPSQWEDALNALLLSLGHVRGRRPPLAVICEDPHTMRRAAKALRIHGNTLRPQRARPVELGAYLDQPGMIGSAAILPADLPTVNFDADIKDASLAPLRTALLSLGSKLRDERETDCARAVSQALGFLRRSVSLPFGIREAREIADVIHDGDDEVDLAVRDMFRPKMALAKLSAIANLVPSKASEALDLSASIQAKVAAWEEETPVSAKLATLLDAAHNGAVDTLVVVPDRRVADLFILSERVRRWKIDVVAAEGLAAQLAAAQPRRMIVVGPTPEILHVLLTSAAVPASVSLLGDSSGVGLLAAELGPIERLSEFAPLAARALALRKALSRGGADESLDLGEASFEASDMHAVGKADFTRSGEAYAGDTILIRTRRGEFVYRPGSTVLVHSAGEIRPFVPKEAQRIRIGDAILALSPDIHETLRRAISGSRKSRDELATYHKQVAARRGATPGATLSDKARQVVEAMKLLDASVCDAEWQNVRRWLSADQGVEAADGGRQPGAARQWERFRVFWEAAGVHPLVSEAYWRAAIVPTRSYRVQEGFTFNQRVTQFVLDPEGTALGAGRWAAMPQLWQMVESAVDEVIDVKVDRRKGDRADG